MKSNFVILAKSVKHQGYCVAGKELSAKTWCRFVSDANGKELDSSQVQVKNPHGAFDVKPLQKVKVVLNRHAPLINHQPENWIIGDQQWEQDFSISKGELSNFLDYPLSLWGAGSSIDYFKIQNRSVKVEQSLYLVQIKDFKPYRSGQNKRRAKFTFNGIEYDLPVTAKEFDSIIGDQNVLAALKGVLCVSLGENFHGVCYKLIAAIY